MNKIILIGRLGADPVGINNGGVRFSFAVDSNRKNKDGERETTWFQVAFFGKNAETLTQYAKKGSQLLVDGEMTSYKRKIEVGGETMEVDAWSVTGKSFEFYGAKSKGSQSTGDASGETASAPKHDGYQTGDDEDQMPF